MDEDTLYGFSLVLVDGDLVLGDSDNSTALSRTHILSFVDGNLVLGDNDGSVTVNGVGQTMTTFLPVHGKKNLQQALTLRVQTSFGSDIYNTTYGLDVREAFTQPGTLSRVKEFIKLSLVRTLSTDPRVQDIRDVLFADDPRFQAQYGQVDVDAIRRSRSWPVVVLIDTVDAQTTTLSVNIGV